MTQKRKNNGVTDTLKLLNKASYNELILAQEDIVCFRITEEEKSQQVWRRK